MEEPLVSISCITYNHVNYIRECLEGFLMQKTTFPFEILIHDDASTDGTTEIIKEYEEKYPDLIKPIYESENQWCLGRRGSAVFNYPRSKGKYIALCEGDDYWSNPYKLQRQIDFLEENKEFSACTHQSTVIYEHNELLKHEFEVVNTSVLNLRDLLNGRKFHTASVVFKSEIIKTYLLPQNILSGDRALNLLLASFGPIFFLQETMCVYRKNDESISSTVTCDEMKKDLNMISWITKINPKFPRLHYLSFIHRSIALYSKKISYRNKMKHFTIYFILSFSFFPQNLKEIYLKFKK